MMDKMKDFSKNIHKSLVVSEKCITFALAFENKAFSRGTLSSVGRATDS
jgi:hypothetical protein